MARLTLTATDSQDHTQAKLGEIIEAMRGVTAWSRAGRGRITIDYDGDQISPALIEQALQGLGFRVEDEHHHGQSATTHRDMRG